MINDMLPSNISLLISYRNVDGIHVVRFIHLLSIILVQGKINIIIIHCQDPTIYMYLLITTCQSAFQTPTCIFKLTCVFKKSLYNVVPCVYLHVQ